MPIDMLELVGVAPVILFFIGFYGLLVSKTMVKSVIAIGLMETAVILFFLTIGYGGGDRPPILPIAGQAADPLPQALMITAIIISICVTAVNLVMVISLYRRHQTAEWKTVQEKSAESC